MDKKTVKNSKLSLRYLRNTLFYVIVITIIFATGYFLGFRNFYINTYGYPKVHIERDVPIAQKELDFKLFWTVWDRLNEKYYDKDKLIPAKMVYGAIKGMVSSIGDPYTVFLPPSDNKIVQEDLKGSFDGVGIQIGYRKDWLTVIAPVPDSPADKKGVLAGDIIYAIKDTENNIDIKNTQGLSVQEAVSVIRGNKGTVVVLMLVREGLTEPFEVELVRDTLDIPSVTVNYVGEGQKIAHIQLVKFSSETQDEWDVKVIEVLTKGSLGIVLDLRNNPGGYLKGAVDLAADFMDVGEVVVNEESVNYEKDYKIEKMLGRLKNRKLVVLINGGSASASEILAGALRDNNNTVLIGDKSFGKGTIQEPQEMNDGVGLHITIAKWLTPSGIWVNEKGLTPDTEVKDDPETVEDEQLIEAIKYLENE